MKSSLSIYRIILKLIGVLIYFFTIWHVNTEIDKQNHLYIQGKDGGFTVQLYVNAVMSGIYFFIHFKNDKLFFLSTGLLFGGLTIMVFMVMINSLFDISNLYYQIVSMIVNVVVCNSFKSDVKISKLK